MIYKEENKIEFKNKIRRDNPNMKYFTHSRVANFGVKFVHLFFKQKVGLHTIIASPWTDFGPQFAILRPDNENDIKGKWGAKHQRRSREKKF